MKSEDALKKLNKKQQEWIEIHRDAYKQYATEGNIPLMREESIKIFSFLTGLEFAKAISNRDKMLLHIYATK